MAKNIPTSMKARMAKPAVLVPMIRSLFPVEDGLCIPTLHRN
jgi:hypothetical protein